MKKKKKLYKSVDLQWLIDIRSGNRDSKVLSAAKNRTSIDTIDGLIIFLINGLVFFSV